MLYPDFDELIALKLRKKERLTLGKRSVQSIIPGHRHSPFRGQGLEFDAVREYIPGDDIRSIDWRVTARTGAPHLKVFKEERERHQIITVDMNDSMRFGTKNTFKSVVAARIASLLSWQAINSHDHIGACLFGDVFSGIQFFTPSKTKKSLYSFFKMLASPPIEQHQIALDKVIAPLAQGLHIGSLVYVISDFLKIPNELDLSPLSKKGDLIFIAVNDPLDKALFPAGALKFSCSDHKIDINTDDDSGRALYEKEWKQNRKKLYDLTSNYKIPLLEVSTESDLIQDLFIGLKMMGKKR